MKRTGLMDKIVYIVHCIDAEGPLRESLEATFERLKDIFGISLEPSEDTLRKIQNRKLNFGILTDEIANVFSSHNLNYNDTWEKIDAVLKKISSSEFRNKLLDSFGGGWIYNWFSVDHVGYEYNPRMRVVGYHKIYDFYKDALKRYGLHQDGLHWHFHPMSIYKEAHRCGTSYVNSQHLYESLCRKIIERKYFPSAVRAGFHAERPDSNLFFEQWIPFDFSNWAHSPSRDLENQKDLKGGRLGDWRLAPDDWSVYQPSHDNWQMPGRCRRWIARAVDIMVRGKDLTQQEIDKAFKRANSGKPTLMGCVSHDFRDMSYEVAYVREKIAIATQKYKDVKFKFSEAIDAFKSVIYEPSGVHEPIRLKISLDRNSESLFLKVESIKGEVFGPQPFLAVKMKSGRFIHDNFDFDISVKKWSYTFDNDSIRPEDVNSIGVATNDKYGNTFMEVINL
jgi:hypothetical protein